MHSVPHSKIGPITRRTVEVVRVIERPHCLLSQQGCSYPAFFHGRACAIYAEPIRRQENANHMTLCGGGACDERLLEDFDNPIALQYSTGKRK
jgi:hypothetical protein